MNTGDHYLSIANKATFLTEKLSQKKFEGGDYESVSCESLKRLWEASLQEGGSNFLSKRIEAIGIKEEAIGDVLSSITYTSFSECPEWISILDEICQYYLKREAIVATFVNQDSPIPFEEIIIPVILFIRNRCQGYSEFFSTEAQTQLERSLLESLSRLLAPCLYLEACVISGTESIDYKKFVNQFIAPENGERRLLFFEEYAVLARILVSDVKNWIAFLSFLKQSINNDIECLKLFLGKEELGLISNLEIGISDKHDKGKSVVKLTFESGCSVFFKPRNSSLEGDFFSFVSYLNSTTPSALQIRLPRILQRNGYSWVEAIDFTDIKSERSLRKYYKRCGALLYVAHLFNGTDFHYENVVCNGEFPVLVDTETLLQPQTQKFKKAERSSGEDLFLNSSVLMTLLLPQWHERDESSAYDVGGFTATQCYTGFFEPKWFNINRQGMGLSFEEVLVNPQKHKPLSESNTLYDYRHSFLKGFSQCHRFVLKRKSEILKEVEKEQWFQNVLTRVVVRPTKVYAKLIERLKHPKYLRSGLAYGIELEQLLLNAFEVELTPNEFQKWLGFYEIECQSLQEMNVPIFHANTNQLHLFSGEENIFPYCFIEPGVNLLKQNLNLRDKRYEKIQTKLISCSIVSRHLESLYYFEIKPFSRLGSALNYIEIASNIGDQLIASAFQSESGDVYFPTLTYNALTKKYVLEVLGNNFMSGKIGIAFFYACLFDATKNEKYRTASNRCLPPQLLGDIQDVKERFSQTPFLLGFDGLAGFIYGFSKVAYYTGEEKHYESAREVIEYVRTNCDFNTHLDQVFGIAGLINSIVNYSNLSRDGSYETFLSQLGDIIVEKGYEKWGSTLQDSTLTGFSHGISGISYSLICLGEYLNSDKYNKIALAALEYESSFYDPTLKGWRDSREHISSGEPRAMIDWAHGATGIGLARCSLNPKLLSDRLSLDIRLISDCLNETIRANEYNLANGILGVIDFEFRRGGSGIEGLNQVLEQFHQQGVFAENFSPREELTWQPSLFYGAAGLGYQLLRVQNPTRYPSVLLFD